MLNDLIFIFNEIVLTFLAQLLIIAHFWIPKPKKPPDPSLNPSATPVLRVAPEGELLVGEAPVPDANDVFYVGSRIPARFNCTTKVRSQVLATMNRRELTLATGLSFSTADPSEATQFILDTGSTHHICNNKALFDGPMRPIRGVELSGIGGSLHAKAAGRVKLLLRSDFGIMSTVYIDNTLYVPDSPANLISPQKLTGRRDTPAAVLVTSGPMTIFSWGGVHSKTIHHNPHLDLPMLNADDTDSRDFERFNHLFVSSCQACTHTNHSHSRCSKLRVSEGATAKAFHVDVVPFDGLASDSIDSYAAVDVSGMSPPALDTDSDSDSDSDSDDEHLDSDFETLLDKQSKNELSPAASVKLDELIDNLKSPLSAMDIEWLKIHHRLNHLPYSKMRKLASKGIIPSKFADSSFKPPACPACTFGKQQRRRWRTSKDYKSLRKATKLGDRVHVDHMHSSQPGFIGQVKGWLTRRRYVGSLVFVEELSDFTYVHHIEEFSDEETLKGKRCFENLMASYDVQIRSYHADNGSFSSSMFMEDCLDKQQVITFCGVGAHHQSGIVERRIGDLTPAARTALVHAQHHFKAVVKTMLWPFAFSHSARIRNLYYLGDDGLCPLERLSKVKHQHDIRHEHPLFCPSYLLKRPLQSGSKLLPKWDPRSTAGIYLGMSPSHASTVALFMDLGTGHVTPQYHLVFDDNFSTVNYLQQGTIPPFWSDLVRNNSEDYGRVDPLSSVELEIERLSFKAPDDSPAPPNDGSGKAAPDDGPVVSEAPSRSPSLDPSQPKETTSSKDRKVRFVDELDARDSSLSNRRLASEGESHLWTRKFDRKFDVARKFDVVNIEEAGLRRSGRKNRKPVDRYSPKHFLASILSFVSIYRDHADQNGNSKEVYGPCPLNFHQESSLVGNALVFNTVEGNDTYTLSTARKQEDWNLFCDAMLKEIDDHTKRGHWEIRKRSSIGKVPVIQSVWSFKRKRRPDGTLIKHKARLCAHGGMQTHGENYWDTYSPVVKWMSIRTMLTIALIKKLHTRSIDFTLAFPQADVDVEIYMAIPYGFKVVGGGNDRYVLELKKNLYGLKQAGKTWFEYLSTTLTQDLGFTQSAIDQCVFYREGVVFIVWVDDCLCFHKNPKDADLLMQELMGKFTLTEEGELGLTAMEYLGVQMTRTRNNKFVLNQPFLIDRIIQAAKMEGANPVKTPAEKGSLLFKDKDGAPRKTDWNYRSLVGMLSYLTGTRPDILFAVHNCARFSTDPKLSHEKAIKRIVKYLIGTKDKGIILNPELSKGVECFVDAGFAGDYHKDRSEDSENLLSRTGYVIRLWNCPIIAVSKMMTEITLSTTEAEYVALSHSMRDVIPFLDFITEVTNYYELNLDKPHVKCTLFEDNNGALELAKAPKYRPRTKHIALKYHHFRDHVKRGLVKIFPIDTKEQLADIFTKPLDQQTFEYLRNLLLGW